MPEQIYTFTDEELVRMFKSGEMKVLTTPEITQQETDHERALRKAKQLFGENFKDVQTLEIGGKTAEELNQELSKAGIIVLNEAKQILNSPNFSPFLIKGLQSW